MEIAIYGKGGIGKSTISANLTAALALSGQKVLQIGCDPKHDSTKLLMRGVNIPTVLDYLKDRPREAENAADVLKEGFMGCGCIEAGGPKPGVGCAGRGIISAFEFLSRHCVKENYETIVYDVLGDVVCGGFAVPVRRQYADAVFLVTSGEFMALYAANNILKGIYNFDGDKFSRVGGIIFNERKLPDEQGRVERFAASVGLPICAKVPRSPGFAHAEEANVTLMELKGFEEEKAVFYDLARKIINTPPLYPARPLSDQALEEAVLNTGAKNYSFYVKEDSDENTALKEASPQKEEVKDEEASLSAGSLCRAGAETGENSSPENNMLSSPEEASAPSSNRAPLYGCAFNGAATQAVHLTDGLVIAHSPRECAFYTWQNISSSGRKNLFNRGILLPSAISPNFECTDMGHTEIVFGGMDTLRAHVQSAIERGFRAVTVVSSCVSGIIGDDIKDIENMSTPETCVISIPADGDINGDYMEGISLCMHTLAKKLIDPNVKPSGLSVNFINEAGVSNNRDLNFKTLSGLLKRMGINVNCRFLGDAKADEIKNLKAAPLNILADNSQQSLELKDFLEENYGLAFLDMPFPTGFHETKEFLLKIGNFFGCTDKALSIIEEETQSYEDRIRSLSGTLKGKKILMTTINASLMWLIDAAKRAGMEFVWIGVLNYLHTDLCAADEGAVSCAVEEFSSSEIIYERIEQYRPDIVISNYTSAVKKGDYIMDALPMSTECGFEGAIGVLEKWAGLFKKQGDEREGGWKNDKALFQKYFC